MKINEAPIFTTAKAIEYRRKILERHNGKTIQTYHNKLQHNYDVANFKSKYSNLEL